LTKKLNSLRRSYPSFKEFAIEFNPQTQVNFAENVKDTIEGDYSTLEVLDMALGENTSAKWLTVAITEINEFCGSKSMSDEQIKSLARIIVKEHKTVKFSIMQLFFYRFKCGDFGKFYGKVDPMVITCALKDFIEECKQKHQEYARENYITRAAREDKYREKVYRNWYNLCQELFENIKPTDKECLISMDIKQIYTEESCLEISLTKQQYEILCGNYKKLFTKMKKKYFSNIITRLRYNLQNPDNDRI